MRKAYTEEKEKGKERSDMDYPYRFNAKKGESGDWVTMHRFLSSVLPHSLRKKTGRRAARGSPVFQERFQTTNSVRVSKSPNDDLCATGKIIETKNYTHCDL